MAKQPRVNGKEVEVTKGVAPDATKPGTALQDPTKDKEAPRMEIVLATLPLPVKGDPKGIDQGSLKTTVQGPTPRKNCNKKSRFLYSSLFLFSFFVCNFCFGF